MSVVKIGDRLVGYDQPTYVIAEIGVNHNGILPLAIELIDAAISAGADAVKFQKRNLDQLYAKKYLDNHQIYFSSPEQVLSGSQYSATLYFILPENIKANATINKELKGKLKNSGNVEAFWRYGDISPEFPFFCIQYMTEY